MSSRAGQGGLPAIYARELAQRGFRLQRTPLDVAAPLRAHREASNAAWVFTSATLAVAGRFDHVAQRLGVEHARELLEPSPFDWDRQALCYLPQRLPDAAVEALRTGKDNARVATALSAPVCIRSLTFTSSFRPSAPAGWNSPKFSFV